MLRREAIDVAKDIYFFLKNTKKEYSINQIAKKMKAKYEITIRCLIFLKEIGLIKERREDKPRRRLFSVK